MVSVDVPVYPRCGNPHSCDSLDPTTSPVCVSPPTGGNVLDGIGLSYPVVENKDQVAQDIGILVAIGAVYKIFYIIGVTMKMNKSAKIQPNEHK